MRLLHRVGTIAVAALALAACEESKTALLPLDTAMSQPPKVAVTEETALVAPRVTVPEAELAAGAVEVGGRRWQVTATEYALPEQAVRPVGAAAGMPLYALAWDSEPYDRLLTPARPGVWRELLETR